MQSPQINQWLIATHRAYLSNGVFEYPDRDVGRSRFDGIAHRDGCESGDGGIAELEFVQSEREAEIGMRSEREHRSRS